MRKSFLILATIFAVVPMNGWAFACKEYSAEEAYDKHDYLILAKVVKTEDFSFAQPINKLISVYQNIVLDVEYSWKPTKGNTRLTIDIATNPYGERRKINAGETYFFALDSNISSNPILMPCSKFFIVNNQHKFINQLHQLQGENNGY